MEIKTSPFVLSLVKPSEFLRSHQAPKRKKIALLVGAIALSILSVGVVPLICFALYKRAIRPIQGSKKTDAVKSKIFQESREQPYNKMTLKELAALGEKMSVEELLSVDLRQLTGANRIEKFEALFGTKEIDSEKGEKTQSVIKRLDTHTIVLNIDLFQDSERYGPFILERKEDGEIFDGMTLSLEDCERIGSICPIEMRSWLIMALLDEIPTLGKKEFQALLGESAKEIIPEMEGSAFIKALFCFSQEHWDYLTDKQDKTILSLMRDGKLSEDEWPPLINPFLNRRAKQATTILSKLIKDIDSNKSREFYEKDPQQHLTDIFPFLSEELKKVVPEDKKPLNLQDLQKQELSEEEIDTFNYSRTLTKEREALLNYLFPENKPERKSLFVKIYPMDIFPYLSSHHILWLGGRQLAKLSFTALAKFLKVKRFNNEAFYFKINAFIQNRPPKKEKLSNSDYSFVHFDFPLIFKCLDKKSKALVCSELPPDQMAALFSDLTSDEVLSITKKQFEEIDFQWINKCCSETIPEKELAFRKNLNLLLARYPDLTKLKFIETPGDRDFPTKMGGIIRYLDEETKNLLPPIETFSEKTLQEILFSLNENQIRSITQDQFKKLNIWKLIRDHKETPGMKSKFHLLLKTHPDEFFIKLEELKYAHEFNELFSVLDKEAKELVIGKVSGKKIPLFCWELKNFCWELKNEEIFKFKKEWTQLDISTLTPFTPSTRKGGTESANS